MGRPPRTPRWNAQFLLPASSINCIDRIFGQYGIDTGDLPLDAQIDVTELGVAPYYRSGVLLKFPVQQSNGALLVLLLEDGAPMPVGSVVNLVGRDGEFPVAQRGEVYVTGLAEKNRLLVTWRGQSCNLDVEFGKGLGPLPRLGQFICAGVKR